MTREVLGKLPEAIRKSVEGLRHNYLIAAGMKEIAREQSAWYLKGLRDAGIITERERQILFVYTTV